jgi:hypothetical protein
VLRSLIVINLLALLGVVVAVWVTAEFGQPVDTADPAPAELTWVQTDG